MPVNNVKLYMNRCVFVFLIPRYSNSPPIKKMWNNLLNKDLFIYKSVEINN